MWSYWEQSEIIGSPDYTIIGSGIVGLNAAIQIKRKQPNADVLIIESGSLPSGASTKNAGFACFGSPSEILMDLDQIDEDVVFSTLEKRWKGLRALRDLLGDDNLGYEEPGSYELFIEADSNRYQTCLDAIPYLNEQVKRVVGFHPYRTANDIIEKNGFSGFVGAINNKGEGQINTGKMMQNLLGLASQLKIRVVNGLPAVSLQDQGDSTTIRTPEGEFSSRKVLIATNGFAKTLIPELNIVPARAQVIITKPIDNLKVKGTYHFSTGYYYFRNVGNRILFGGGRNLDFDTEQTTSMELNDTILSKLSEFLDDNILPNTDFEIEQKWTGIMGVGEHKLPFVQMLSENIACSVKLGGMGVAIGTLTGQEGADLIMG